MFSRKIIHSVLSVLVVASLLFGGGGAPLSFEPGVANAMPMSLTDETKVPHYFGPYPNWANSPLTLPDAVVTIAPPITSSYGNPLMARAYPTDGAANVFVVNTHVPLVAGVLTAFQTWAQVPAATGPYTFNAYVLRPTPGVVNGYTVVLASGPFSVSDAMTGIQTFPLTAPFAVLDGDLIAHYGQGIPIDIGLGGGLDTVFYPADTVPTLGTAIDVVAGDATFPLCDPVAVCGDRTYSFAASAGTGATAVASVGANGAITGITVTDPSSGYTADPAVAITGAGTGAAATATVTTSGFVTSITVTPGSEGSGYTEPFVTISGGGATTDATATAYGSVEKAAFEASLVGGSGYTFPTIDFDMPDDPNGVQATAHVELPLGLAGEILTIVLDDPGSGYAAAPKVVIRDGTLFDPINNGGIGASATATLSIQSVVMDTFGEGYTSAPDVFIGDLNGFDIEAMATAQVDAGGVTSITVTPGFEGSGYVTPGGIKKFTDPLPGLCDPAGVLAPVCPNYLTDGTTGDPLPTQLQPKYIPLAVADTSNPYPVVGGPAREASDTYEIGLVQYRMSFSSSLKDPVTGDPVGTLVRGYVQLESPSWLLAHPGVSQHYPLKNELLDGTLADTGYFGVTPPQYLGPTIVTLKDTPVRIVFRNLLPTGMDGDLFLPVDTTIMGSGMSDMMEPFDPTPTTGGDVGDMVRNPMCTDAQSMGEMCFLKNRATLHLHGGNTPWISDGTVHQWITPAADAADPMTAWPEGVSVRNVPDMSVCDAADDGCQTFYYTNQQSARLMFYHDHSWGITRLNVYAGEAAGYLITDATEQALIGTNGALGDNTATLTINEGLSYGTPLVIQDKTFVPQAEQLAWQDPTWDSARWGGYGNLWYHHVYMPAQNPGDPGGMSAFGRWMYGPWFWPPAGDAKHGPIDNPYYNRDPDGVDGIRGNLDDWQNFLDKPCSLDDPATWQYDTDPFCEPPLIPGTPNISAGMEQFNDTPLVNGTAYPTLTVEPKSYRFRILSAANDRFFNLQWYVGDPTTASTDLNNLPVPEVIGATEVALNPVELAAAQTDPVVFPTPVQSAATAGPDWIQIGTEGGFLPAPVVVDGQQVTTWINDPTRFDVGNVDLHSLLLAPAERADVIVDFSKFAGKTLILYNDAPAAFPARIPSYDYYTGAPDLSPVGVPTILPGYGPNTRTIMQVKVAGTAAPAFNLTKLRSAFSHKANGTGVFESGQHPIIVGQAAYNSAYATSFVSGGWCNSPTNPSARCDGFARISEQGGDMFKFDTLLKNPDGTPKQVSVKLEPKAIHDETNASTFDEFGRMQANLGVEVVPATPGLQNVVLHPMVFPTTEIIDASGLPSAAIKVTPISSGADGTQIWKITHNGVDTHPIHFHAYDVQVLNRVTWDNIIIPPDLTELGWKDTVRIAPLEDTIVALRPIIPKLPFDLPNSIRLLSPMMTDGTAIALSSLADALGLGMTAFAPNGDPIDVYNHYVNYGAEYVYHCHILSHEEMDMMRPVSLAFPPVAPSLLTVSAPIDIPSPRHVDLAWRDNSRSETSWEVQRSPNGNDPWTTIATLPSDPLNPTLSPTTGSSIGGTITYSDPIAGTTALSYTYRVRAINVVGDTWNYADPNLNEIVSGGFPTVTTYSGFSTPATVAITPDAPTGLTPTFQPATNGTTWLPPRVALSWTDNANNEDGFVVERCTGAACTNFAQIAPPPTLGQNTVTFTDSSPLAGNTTYRYQVAATNVNGLSGYSNIVDVTTPDYPAAPSPVNATIAPQGANFARVTLTWTDVANNTRYTVQWATNDTFTSGLVTPNAGQQPGANVSSYTTPNIARNTDFWFRIRATNANGSSAWTVATPSPIRYP